VEHRAEDARRWEGCVTTLFILAMLTEIPHEDTVILRDTHEDIVIMVDIEPEKLRRNDSGTMKKLPVPRGSPMTLSCFRIRSVTTGLATSILRFSSPISPSCRNTLRTCEGPR
jgi:hypothetical protein